MCVNLPVRHDNVTGQLPLHKNYMTKDIDNIFWYTTNIHYRGITGQKAQEQYFMQDSDVC